MGAQPVIRGIENQTEFNLFSWLHLFTRAEYYCRKFKFKVVFFSLAVTVIYSIEIDSAGGQEVLGIIPV